MSIFATIRRLFNQVIEIWLDRDVHIPTIKSALRSVPSRFRAADTSQKRQIIGLILFVAAAQLSFILI